MEKINKIWKFTAKFTEPFLTIALTLAAVPLGLGYLMGKAKSWELRVGLPAAWLGFSYLFSTVLFERVMEPIFNTYPSLAVSSDEMVKAWIAEAALIALGVVLAQLRHIVAGGWSWGTLELSYRPALIVALAAPFAVLVNLSDVREGDPVRVIMNAEERLRDASTEEIERFNWNARMFLKPRDEASTE